MKNKKSVTTKIHKVKSVYIYCFYFVVVGKFAVYGWNMELQSCLHYRNYVFYLTLAI